MTTSLMIFSVIIGLGIIYLIFKSMKAADTAYKAGNFTQAIYHMLWVLVYTVLLLK